ncbi:hypothetical protein J2Y69_002135 [Microbacterium resistens]|uniref:HNH nuclease domain-containing protein n=1 Tax=Microbacterium resistens TaxID=156977 RepID=A0ABU1SD48_9MICO|nr:hypothetical protein [Microbacterium resistens]
MGDFPRDLFILHACDNRRCVNPEHLSLGDGQANMDDMNAKGRGRFPHGEIHGNAKLSDADVDQIHAMARNGDSRKTIAARFEISTSHVTKIVSGASRSRPAGYDSAALR